MNSVRRWCTAQRSPCTAVLLALATKCRNVLTGDCHSVKLRRSSASLSCNCGAKYLISRLDLSSVQWRFLHETPIGMSSKGGRSPSVPDKNHEIVQSCKQRVLGCTDEYEHACVSFECTAHLVQLLSLLWFQLDHDIIIFVHRSLPERQLCDAN